MDTSDIGALARQLAGAPVGYRWAEEDVRTLVAGLGWQWTDTAAGPCAVTGLVAGPARVVPVGEPERKWTSYEFIELAVPTSNVDGDALSQATEFRRVADAVRAALGPATVVGSYGTQGPFDRVNEVSWGTPYLRWRSEKTTVELRVGGSGPELVLQDSSVWEFWYNRLRYDAGRSVGFIGALEGDRSLEHPGFAEAGTWQEVTAALARVFATLPAETLALGVSMSIPLYGWIGNRAPLLFDLVCDDRLYVGYYEPETSDTALDAGAADLGWRRTDLLPPGHVRKQDDGEPPWRVDAGGPGEVDGAATAELIVRTARAAGVTTAGNLMLGGEGEYRHPYRLRFPGLAMRSC